jgi:hypothetical protein
MLVIFMWGRRRPHSDQCFALIQEKFVSTNFSTRFWGRLWE